MKIRISIVTIRIVIILNKYVFQYYSTPATGMIKSKYADVGVRVDDVVTIISGDKRSVEIVMNFSKEPSRDIIKIQEWLGLTIKLASQMVLGIEPVETLDEVIYTVSYNGKT